MSSANLTVLIPALKKNVAFQDDLIKKLNGISLIQRAINIATGLGVEKQGIHLLTDSDEIRLIAERNGTHVYWNPKLDWCETDSFDQVRNYLKSLPQKYTYTLLLSPYAPLLSTDLLNKAKQEFISSNRDILKPVKKLKKNLYDENDQSILQAVFSARTETHSIDSNAFTLFRTHLFKKATSQKLSVLSWPVEHDLIEIESFQDWWVCEKLIARRRIVFRVIGNKQVGMGHIYRALSLAHDITDHEIIFVCDLDNIVAVKKLAGYDYRLDVYEAGKVVENIVRLKPDLVINDILSTKEEDVLPLQHEGIKVVSFEDLGEGAKLADLTINELYDEAQYESDNTLWGSQYFFVREEFDNAISNRFKKKVKNILLTFGGTDQHNLTSKIFHAISSLCSGRGIHTHIVTGSGYTGYNKLYDEIKDDSLVTITQETGIISSIMENIDLAIVSNGRTIYELAHMNIPAIVISQHQRENKHSFAIEENGFVPMGLFDNNKTVQEVCKKLENILDNDKYRQNLFSNTTKYIFSNNKDKVLKEITLLIESYERT
jgi:spore coat polysaccharide biosynthesis predicted glycosyltransferase SpsG/CMP-N-acetylneuraminic acid synthetase